MDSEMDLDDPLVIEAEDELEPSFGHETYTTKSEIPYRHVEVLGHGSFGHVDKVERTAEPFSTRHYARKIIRLPPFQPRAEEILVDIRREVGLILMLQHMHIVRVVGTYVCLRSFGMIMSPVADENLEEYLLRVDQIPEENASHLRGRLLQWFGCMVGAVEYIHGKHIRHRDIKPANFLIRGRDVLLTDFGIAMELPPDTLSTSTMTPGARTRMYCAPEVEEGHRRGRLADIFSLGTVFLEMLTVYSGHQRLQRFNSMRGADGGQSYAKNLDIVASWIRELGKDSHVIPWYEAMLYICEAMLDVDQQKRPTAQDLLSCWQYIPLPGKWWEFCECRLLRLGLTSGEKLRAGLFEMLQKKHPGTIGFQPERFTLLTFAAWWGDLRRVQAFLHAGADINATDKDYKTAIYRATEGDSEEMVRFLLANGADPLLGDQYGLQPIHVAAGKGYFNFIRLFTDHGVDPETKTLYGDTPLYLAVGLKCETAFQLLRKMNTDVDWALYQAILKGTTQVAKLLLSNGARPGRVATYDGRGPLCIAIERGDIEMVRFLLENGVDPNELNHTGSALTEAVYRKNLDMVQLLFDYGVEPNLHSKIEGGAPLCRAIGGSDLPMVQLLLDKGADPNGREGHFAERALHSAVAMGLEEITLLLLDRGADLHAQDDKNGWTPLHRAACTYHTSIAQILLEKGADPYIRDKRGRTCLDLAASRGHQWELDTIL